MSECHFGEDRFSLKHLILGKKPKYILGSTWKLCSYKWLIYQISNLPLLKRCNNIEPTHLVLFDVKPSQAQSLWCQALVYLMSRKSLWLDISRLICIKNTKWVGALILKIFEYLSTHITIIFYLSFMSYDAADKKYQMRNK